MTLENKVIVITGASGGIGAALAEAAGAQGACLVLAARREPELREVARRSGTAVAVVTDVTRRAEVQALCAAAVARFGHVDVWVNNAGRGLTCTVADLSDEAFDDMMRVNVKSALYGMQTVLPHLVARGHGHIINVSSMLGRLPYVSVRSAYSAAKTALASLSTNLRLDLKARYPQIHVSTVFPGAVATDFGRNAGGPDSRTFPAAQPVEEVARIILELIEHPRAEVYTRPEYARQVAGYHGAEDVTMAEAQPPFLWQAPPR